MIFLPVTQAYSEKEIRITSTSAIRLQLNLCKQDNCRPISRWMSTDVQKNFRIYCSILLEGFLLNMRTSYQAAFEWFINRTGPVYTWVSKQCEKRYFSRLNTEFSKEISLKSHQPPLKHSQLSKWAKERETIPKSTCCFSDGGNRKRRFLGVQHLPYQRMGSKYGEFP